MLHALEFLAPLGVFFGLIFGVCWLGEKMGWSERTDELIIAGVLVAGMLGCIMFG